MNVRQLRALMEAATPGPYATDVDRFDDTEYVATVWDPCTDLLATIGTDVKPYSKTDGEWTSADSETRDACYRAACNSQGARDAALICAAVNALPQLLAIAEAAEKLANARRKGWRTHEAMLLVEIDSLFDPAIDAARKGTT